MSEAVDSPIIFDDSISVDESVEVAVADVTDEIETIEIDDSVAVDSSNTKKKPLKSNIPTVLPLSKVKKICKLDPAVNLITADAVKLITFCTERFIELLAKSCVSCAKENGRKTVSNADFQRAIRRSWLFYMLDEALDEWPETTSTKRPKSGASNRSNNEDENVVDEPEDNPNEDEEVADTDDVIHDDEVIEIDTNETVEVERALTPVSEEFAMEEDVEDGQIIIAAEEEEENSEEESDIENQEEDTTNNDDDDIYVKDIEDL